MSGMAKKRGVESVKKDAFYFPHYSNARHDRKIQRIRKDLGMEGYGIFFMLLEVLREQMDFTYPVKDIDLLADEFGTSTAKLEAVINAYDLFQMDASGNFFSPKFVFYLQPWIQKKEQMRKAAITRWGKAETARLERDESVKKALEFGEFIDKVRGTPDLRLESPNCFSVYESNIGMLTPNIAEQIKSYLNDGIEDELISKCVHIACEQNKRNWSYTKAILDRCANTGTKTLKDFEVKELEYKNSKQKNVDKFVKENGRLPNYANFDQREYTEEELEPFYVSASNKYKKEE